MIRFIVDVNLGNGVEKYLESLGYDVLTVRSVNPSMEDKQIVEIACREERIILTLDKDFGDLVYKSGMNHKGILILRIEDWSLKNKKDVLDWILNQHIEELQNAFSIYHKGVLRIRKK